MRHDSCPSRGSCLIHILIPLQLMRPLGHYACQPHLIANGESECARDHRSICNITSALGSLWNSGTFMVPLTLPTNVWSHVAAFLNVKDAARLSGESSSPASPVLMLGRRSHLHCKVSGQAEASLWSAGVCRSAADLQLHCVCLGTGDLHGRHPVQLMRARPREQAKKLHLGKIHCQLELIS